MEVELKLWVTDKPKVTDNKSMLSAPDPTRYGEDNVIEIVAPTNVNTAGKAILNYFSIPWKNNKLVFRLDWHKIEKPERPLNTEVYKEDTPEFEKLKKCNEIFEEERLFN
uniref:Uncharacterized protein n=1 Tax=Meloidogyne hapla TaxID=6305 RepID=A0A1I8C0C3_MELHA